MNSLRVTENLRLNIEVRYEMLPGQYEIVKHITSGISMWMPTDLLFTFEEC